jgi:hypothetical protein
MKTIIKPVYYCDFCNKKGLSKSAMLKHEKHCTANPQRECRLCESIENDKTDIVEIANRHKNDISTIIDASGFKSITINNPKLLEELFSESNGCPMCILTILKQIKCPCAVLNWDFKKAVSDFWIEQNNEINERIY